MWTTKNRPRYDRDKLRYPSDLTDEEWSLVEPLIPPAKRGGRKREVEVREVVNGVMYVLSTGCQWRYIPKDLPPRSTVHDYLTRWNDDGTIERIHHALYVQCREALGREASPTACVIDSQSVKSAEKRLSCLSSVVPTFHDLSWTAAPQGWRVAPPPSAASALTHRVARQSGF
jgi:transposase